MPEIPATRCRYTCHRGAAGGGEVAQPGGVSLCQRRPAARSRARLGGASRSPAAPNRVGSRESRNSSCSSPTWRRARRATSTVRGGAGPGRGPTGLRRHRISATPQLNFSCGCHAILRIVRRRLPSFETPPSPEAPQKKWGKKSPGKIFSSTSGRNPKLGPSTPTPFSPGSSTPKGTKSWKVFRCPHRLRQGGMPPFKAVLNKKRISCTLYPGHLSCEMVKHTDKSDAMPIQFSKCLLCTLEHCRSKIHSHWKYGSCAGGSNRKGQYMQAAKAHEQYLRPPLPPPRRRPTPAVPAAGGHGANVSRAAHCSARANFRSRSTAFCCCQEGRTPPAPKWN